jgi:7-keto-8-aminopelargonate synthetase-like enzyme
MDRVDIITGTMGKALGGASGWFYFGQKGNYRTAATTFQTVPFFKYTGTFDSGSLD